MNSIFPSAETVNMIRNVYPKGTKVELVSMDDFQAPPIGTKGIVEFVDDNGAIHIRWENGSGLAALFGVDVIRVIEK